MKTSITKDYETTRVLERRISYLVGARLRDKDKIKVAIKKQDKIRKLHPASEHWDSISEIRKWRDSR